MTQETTISAEKKHEIPDFDVTEPFPQNESLLLNDEDDINEYIMSAATYDQGLNALLM